MVHHPPFLSYFYSSIQRIPTEKMTNTTSSSSHSEANIETLMAALQFLDSSGGVGTSKLCSFLYTRYPLSSVRSRG